MAGVPQAYGVGGAQALTDGATITLDLTQVTAQIPPATSATGVSQGNSFKVTLAGSRTLNVIGPVDGQILHLFVTQDGTGSRTLTVTVNGQSSSVLTSGTPLSTSAGSLDLVALQYRADLGKLLYYPIAKALA